MSTRFRARAAEHQDFWTLMTLAGFEQIDDSTAAQTVGDIAEHVGGLAGRRVADLGSGCGRHAAALLSHRPAGVTAIEKSPLLAEMSRSMYPDVDVVVETFTNIGGLGSFDVVVALSHLLFIQPDIESLLADLRHIRAAMPDFGCLVIEQFDISTDLRQWGTADGLQVDEATRQVSPQKLQHEFTVLDCGDPVMATSIPSLVLARAEFEEVVREAGFLVSDCWEQRASAGELSLFFVLRAQKGFNYLSDMPDFLESWITRSHERNRMSRTFTLDEHGRARPQGVFSWGQGASLSRNHPEFVSCLEPAIRPLVLELVDEWNLVTYSSCDGHVVSERPRREYSESYCGVVAFDDDHEAAVVALVESTLVGWCSDEVRPVVRRRALLSPYSRHRAVDLLLTRTGPEVTWESYVEQRDRCISHVCSVLAGQRG
ncbi:class I SAM-dependent methyltransferase [Antrihabitans spumae]|uniref:Class I SAM-dependent methyltransferase n=1 Tax=Antrihabitans spumae TaxID=3373370 RepID=A0ABW7KPM4_9NOCA